MHGPEGIESEVILQEFPGALGLALWKTVRSIRLWAEVAENVRSATFESEARSNRLELIEYAEVPEEIRTPMEKLSAVLQPRARAATVATACREVAGWAEERGALGTALEFLQAAAVTLPLDAEIAHAVARVARARGEYPRAETWFRHGISRARRSQNRYYFAKCYIGLGNIYILRGNSTVAKRNLIRGLRAAKRFTIRPLIGRAYQELATVAIRTNSTTDVHRYTRAALDSSAKDDPRLADLVYDYGVFLLDSGYYKEAFRTLASVPAALIGEQERFPRAAALARAAVLAGEPDAYEEAWAEAEGLLADLASAERPTGALLMLAQGAVAAGDSERARSAAEEAQQLARERGEAEMELTATGILESLREGNSIEVSPEARRSSPRVRQLIDDLEAAMEDLQSA